MGRKLTGPSKTKTTGTKTSAMKKNEAPKNAATIQHLTNISPMVTDLEIMKTRSILGISLQISIKISIITEVEVAIEAVMCREAGIKGQIMLIQLIPLAGISTAAVVKTTKIIQSTTATIREATFSRAGAAITTIAAPAEADIPISTIPPTAVIKITIRIPITILDPEIHRSITTMKGPIDIAVKDPVIMLITGIIMVILVIIIISSR